MSELTIVANGVRALLDVAVAKGANRNELLRRSGIDPDELLDRDGRVAFSKFVLLMRAGQELSHDAALALHFGEAVDVSEVSIGCTLGGVNNIDEAFAQVNRYASLAVEVEGVEGEKIYQ
ncbi:MAG TPA: AraC family transcriptional regulator ligand-binding domain-containing protein, partial [Gemmatimonadaceae bacterium]|nr:AraC family transcriptional regulator ligand-binding domain-containing protein [Gemmatimonadaceae bacterium]